MPLGLILPIWGFFKSLFTGKDHEGAAVNRKFRWIMIGIVLLIIALVVGLRLSYNAGVRTGNATVEKFVKDQNAKTAKKEAAQSAIQTAVQTDYQTKIRWITKTRVANQVASNDVPDVAVDQNQQAFIPMGAINVMNAAALNKPIDPEAAKDTRDSGVTLPVLTDVVVQNYSESHDKDAIIDAWESWYEKSYKLWMEKNVPDEFYAKKEEEQ